MSGVLIATKVHMPALRTGHIRREALLARLDAGLARGHRPFLLSAPAGYGKSSLSRCAHAGHAERARLAGA